MINKKVIVLGLSILCLIGAILIGLFAPQHTHDEHEEHDHDHEETIVKLSDEQLKQQDFEILTAQPGNLHLQLSARGRIMLHPDRLAHILPKMAGVAQEALKNIGDTVQAGEAMAILESHDMAEIKASYLAALSKERLAKSALEREEKLVREKISAEQDLFHAKNAYEESVIGLQLATQKLKTFGVEDREIDQLATQNQPDLRLYTIHSPIDGAVIARHITKGEFLESTSVIYEVADLETVWVEMGIYPKDLAGVKEGQKVDVFLPIENRKDHAKIIYVSPIVSEETITAKAIAQLDNHDKVWRPGVFVQVNIATNDECCELMIPKAAVQTNEGENYIFVVTSEGFEKRSVKLGKSDVENVEVLLGLKPGEQYVGNKTFLLKAELGKGSAEHEH